MPTNKGTPKSLVESISNGLEGAETVFMSKGEADGLAAEVKEHVLDYLRQKFGVAYLEMPNVSNHEQAMSVLKHLAVNLGVERE